MKKYKKYIIAFIVVWIGVAIIFNRELDFFGLNWFWALVPLGLLYGGADYYIKKQKEKEQEENKREEEEKDDDTPPLNLEEELKYQKISDELEANEINKALWLKAEEEAGGDKAKTRALYIKLRIKSLEYEDDKNNNLDYLHKKLEDLEKKKEEAHGEYTKAT